MSIGLGKGVGIPVKLMHESEGHVITVTTIRVKSFCSFSFPKREGSSEFSLVVTLFFFFFFFFLCLFSRKEMRRKERKSEGRERDGLFDVGDTIFFCFFFFRGSV